MEEVKFCVTLNDTTHQRAFINCPGIGNRAQPSEAGQKHHSSVSLTSQSTALLLIILVILNEASVKASAFLQRQDCRDNVSVDPQNDNGVGQFPSQKAVTQAGHKGNEALCSLGPKVDKCAVGPGGNTV